MTSLQPIGGGAGNGGGGIGGGGSGGSGGGRDVSTTDQYGNSIVFPNATPGEVITATDVAGRVVTTTYHPGVAVQSTRVLSSTLSGGSATLITQTAYVVPDAVTAEGAGAASRTEGAASLQTGNDADTTRRLGVEAFAVAAGALGVAFAL